MKKYTFGIQHEKAGNIIDARNRYYYTDEKEIISENFPTEEQKAAHGVTDEYFCIGVELI